METLARSATTENGDTSVSGPHGRSASLLLALGAAARIYRDKAGSALRD